MAKRPLPNPPPVAAVANKGDLAHGLMLFAEAVADQPLPLVQSHVTEMNLPIIGLSDLYITGSGDDRCVAFTTPARSGTLTAGECSGLAAFFARMASLLQEPRS